MADAFRKSLVATENDGDVVVGVAAGQTIGIDGTVTLGAGAATIGSVGIVGANFTGTSLDVNLTNNVTIDTAASGTFDVEIVAALPAGTNNIGIVSIADSSGTPIPERQTVNVLKDGGTATVNFTAVTNSVTGTLKSMIFTSSVPMKFDVRIDDGASPVVISTIINPEIGSIQIDYSKFAHAISGDGTTHFDVVITNLDRKDDADAYVEIVWDEA